MTIDIDRFHRQSRFAARIANALTIDEEFEGSSPSTSRNLVEGLPFDVWERICDFLSVREYYFLELTCRGLRKIINEVWRNRQVVVLERDFEALRDLQYFQVPESTMNLFSLTADNIWAHLREELDVLYPRKLILTAYNDLRFIIHKSQHLEQLVFLQRPYKEQRVPIGRSFFLFFSFDVLERLHTLDLTMTSFDLYDLLGCANSFPQLSVLIADGACIFMPRKEILGSHTGKELKNCLVDYSKIKKGMAAGTKVFLAAAVEMFPTLTTIKVGGAEYRSSGCITYGYGTEDNEVEYHFVPQTRKRSYCALLLKKAVAQFNSQKYSGHLPEEATEVL